MKHFFDKLEFLFALVTGVNEVKFASFLTFFLEKKNYQ